MTISQPSMPVYLFDVPEAGGFSATFQYNFFVPDEMVNETGGMPSTVLSRSGAERDASFLQYATTRAPRYVVFRWTVPRVADVGNRADESSTSSATLAKGGDQNGSLILDNLDKVVSEDHFSAGGYVSLQFHDGEIDRKLRDIVSGSIAAASSAQNNDEQHSEYRRASLYAATMPEHIKPHWIHRAMTQPQQAGGASYWAPSNAGTRSSPRPGEGIMYVDTFFENVRRVATNVQVNARFLHDMVNAAMRDPCSTNTSDVSKVHARSKLAKHAASQRQQVLSDDDYRPYAPYFWIKKQSTSPHAQKHGAELVGFIIDKFEVMPDGTLKHHQPIVVDNPHVNVSADYRVKFNATYCYSVRSVALLTMPAVEEVTGELATVKVLVSSRPSTRTYVSTLKLNPPPPPRDVDFVWDYGKNKLMVTWAFPITPERDIKQFQVFRRSRLDHPFELQRQFDFDDSVVRFSYNESPEPRLVERLRSPKTFWVDDEFDWNVSTNNSRGTIYSVCSIDAHGQTSCYSAQYRVWFDRFKNKLEKELVSHAGAPKPYPNMYVPGGLFENTIRVSGRNSKRMRLYFNPEFYRYTDNRGRNVRAVNTKQDGGGYVLQFMNIDSMKSADLNITIDDRTSLGGGNTQRTTMSLGPRRMSPPRR